MRRGGAAAAYGALLCLLPLARIPGDLVGLEVVVVGLSVALGALLRTPWALLAPWAPFALLAPFVARGAAGSDTGSVGAVYFLFVYGLLPALAGVLVGLGLRALARRGRRERRVALALPLLGAAATAGVAVAARPAPLPPPPSCPARYRAFAPYHLGPSFDGRPLIEASSNCPEPFDRFDVRNDDVSFVYGGEGDVQVASGPLCQGAPGVFGEAPTERLRVRGVPAALFGGKPSVLYVYTARTAVAIHALDRAQALRAAALMRRAPAADVPPPVDGDRLDDLRRVAPATGQPRRLPPPDRRLLGLRRACGAGRPAPPG